MCFIWLHGFHIFISLVLTYHMDQPRGNTIHPFFVADLGAYFGCSGLNRDTEVFPSQLTNVISAACSESVRGSLPSWIWNASPKRIPEGILVRSPNHLNWLLSISCLDSWCHSFTHSSWSCWERRSNSKSAAFPSTFYLTNNSLETNANIYISDLCLLNK